MSWTDIRINGDKRVVTAVLSGGDRFAVLKLEGHRHDDHHRGGGDATLVLTGAGANSLNNAAAGTPFEAGDVFAGGDDCR